MTRTQRLDVLVFEDRDEEFEPLGRGLSEAGYHVTRAATPDEFRAHAPYAHFCAVIMDLFFGPVRSRDKVGIALTKEVHTCSTHVPVLLVSSFEPGGHDVAESFRAGARDYFDKDELVRNLRSIMASVVESGRETAGRLAEEEFPLPIAFLLRSFNQQHGSAKVRLERLVELFEVVLKSLFCALMGASRANARQDLPSDLRIALRRPSLGHFAEAIRRLPAPEGFVKPLADVAHSRRFGTICERLIQLRNEYIGHGVTQAEAVYEGLLRSERNEAKELLDMVGCLREWTLAWYDSVHPTERSFEYEFLVFQGSNPEPTPTRISTSLILRPNRHVFLLSGDRSAAVDLFPWCQYLVCQERCLNQKVFLYRMCKEGELWMLDHIYGHSLRTRNGWKELQAILGE